MQARPAGSAVVAVLEGLSPVLRNPLAVSIRDAPAALMAYRRPATLSLTLWGSRTRPPVLTWPSMRPARIR